MVTALNFRHRTRTASRTAPPRRNQDAEHQQDQAERSAAPYSRANTPTGEWR
ncbi:MULTISPECIES: hypothetical protein [unclassified Streptomyces]|uniref:hypothetical protein n=1 Tax=unclassified Streptomyces TaxID=2593676 RepID=UPI0023669A1C|nr:MULTISPECIES: hypothetical protein [unclassified Streptomyces]MDF3141508.1 hypothetical protein [Streptomyces sp. T21Q-yed]WDF45011.1 hypothetical protein PBV52_50830 [Streptomyces sp. T12]